MKRAANTPPKFQKTISLREEASGKKQTKGGSTNVKAVLKHEHLQNLAVWASGEASIPSLASLFGHRLAADGEASAIFPDPSFFPCQRLVCSYIFFKVIFFFFLYFLAPNSILWEFQIYWWPVDYMCFKIAQLSEVNKSCQDAPGALSLHQVQLQ